MFETTGALISPEPVASLAWLALLPLVWGGVTCVLALLGARATLAGKPVVAARRDAAAAHVAIAIAGGLVALAVVHAAHLVTASGAPAREHLEPRVLVQHVAQVVRLGQLDLAFDLAVDRVGAVFALLVTLVACASVLHAVWTVREQLALRLLGIGVLTGGALLVVCGEGWFPVLVGLQASTLATWVLARGRRTTPAAISAGADAAIVLGAGLLFWCLGGAYGRAGYAPDLSPRFALVATGEDAPTKPKSTLALTTYAGATVTAEDGPPLPGEPLRAPFVVELEPGVRSFRIQAGVAASELSVTNVTLASGRAYALVPYGPTVSLRNLADQLAVPRPGPLGTTSVRALLASRALAGLPAAVVVGIVFLAAALFRLGVLATADGEAIAMTVPAALAVYVGGRTAMVIEDGGPWPPVLALAAALAAVLLASRAVAIARSGRDGAELPSRRVARAVLSCVLAAALALALGALALGEAAGALVLAVASTLGIAGALAVLEARGDVRWLGVGGALVSGLLPGAGASAGYGGLLLAAGRAVTSDVPARRAAGVALVALVLIVQLLAGVAVFRVYDAAIASPRPTGGDDEASARVLAPILVVVGLLGGAVLGVGTTPFGGNVVPLAHRIADGGPPSAAQSGLVALTFSVGAAALGLLLARRAGERAGAQGAQGAWWLRAMVRPAELAHALAARMLDVGGFLARSVLAVDVHLVADVADLASGAVAAAAGAVRRLELAQDALAERTLGRLSDAVLDRVGLDHPRVAARVCSALLLATVALLGLVVLSSVLLG